LTLWLDLSRRTGWATTRSGSRRRQHLVDRRNIGRIDTSVCVYDARITIDDERPTPL
jgi:hypothetical protein